jgi:uncharacterized protein (TIRG00374 family)
MHKLARLVKTMTKDISGIYYWMTPKGIFISLALGSAAWLLLSLSFIWLLSMLSIDIDWITALSIYPIAMLAGAVSMLPGGIGSTEAAIVAQLASYDVPIAVASIAAICIRIATIWFAILCGAVMVVKLEFNKCAGE